MIRFTGIFMSSDFIVRNSKHFEKAQDYIDRECIRLMEEYVPVARHVYKNYGKMSRSHIPKGSGVIINTEPRAKREYYTNSGASGGLRGKMWFERMKADHKDEIMKKAKENFT